MIATVLYRNPLEQWWWESGVAYWVYGGIALFFVVTFAWVWISDWLFERKKEADRKKRHVEFK